MRKLPQCFVQSMAGDMSQVSPSKSRKENVGRISGCLHGTPIYASHRRSCHPLQSLNSNSSPVAAPSIDPSLVTCNICLEQYSSEVQERVPRTLPYCGHAFCTECFEKLISISHEFIVCPICKKQNSLEHHKVLQDFPCSWALLKLLHEYKKASSKATVRPDTENKEMCNVCKKHEVSHWCRHHIIKLCAYCAFRHMKECKADMLTEQTRLSGLFQQTLSVGKDFVNSVKKKISDACDMKTKLSEQIDSQVAKLMRIYNSTKTSLMCKLDFYILQLEQLQKSAEDAVNAASLGTVPTEDHQLKSTIRNINKLEDLLVKQKPALDTAYQLSSHFDQSAYDAQVEKAHQGWHSLDVVSPYSAGNANCALLAACEKGNLRATDFLLERMKLDVNVRDPSGMTPFCIAVCADNGDLYRLLHDKFGANADAPDNAGKTPLIYACLENREEATEYLVRTCKANPNLQNKWKDTALHSAVEAGNLKLVKMLVEEAGANVNIKNERGKTAAEITMNEEIKRYLLDRQYNT